MMRVCMERREEHLRLWRALGEPRVGRAETDFKKLPVDLAADVD